MARGDGNRIEAGFAVSRQVAFIDHEPAAENPDAKIPSLRQRRFNLEIHNAL
jgi:hypothetical protein